MNKGFVTAVFFLTITVHSNARGQWVQTTDFDRHPWGRAEVWALAANGTNIFAATQDSGVFRSTDNGMSWTAVNKLSEAGAPKAAYSLAVHGTYLFAGSDSGSIFLSTNDGISWVQSRNGDSEAMRDNLRLIVDAFAVSGTNVFAGSFGGGVYRSTDSGSSWTVENNGLVDPYGDTEIYILAFGVNGTDVFGGWDAGGIFLTRDSGRTWTASGLNQSLEPVLAFATIGANIFAGTSIYGVYLSTDSGTDWNAVDSGFPTNIIQLDIQSLCAFGTNIFAATGSAGGVFLSTDTGQNWVSVNDGLPMGGHYVDAFAISGGYLYAGTTDTGVWRRPLSEMLPPDAVAQNPSMNSGIALRVFPNPSKDELQVLGGPAGIARLFDLLGREHAEARDDGSGTSLDISKLEAGTYFLRMGNQSAKVEIAY